MDVVFVVGWFWIYVVVVVEDNFDVDYSEQYGGRYCNGFVYYLKNVLQRASVKNKVRKVIMLRMIVFFVLNFMFIFMFFLMMFNILFMSYFFCLLLED